MSTEQYLSDRALSIDASGIRKVFDLAADLKDPVNLSIGQPHFDVPDRIKQEAVAAIDQGFNRYTPSAGMPLLINAVKDRVPESAGDGKGCVITSGVSGGIVLSFLSLINPGDEVLIPDPGFVSYKQVIRMAGGVPVFYDTYPDFRLHPEHIEAGITDKTKFVVLNSPCNPTGMVFSEDEIRQVAEICAAHSLPVVSDEIYRAFAYTGTPYSISSCYENTIVLRGFSKDYAMTGWRMGYAFGPDDIIQAMIRLQQFSFVCAPSFAQKACVAAFDEDISPLVDDYRNKRDMIADGLKESFELVSPEGAFYCFPKVPAGSGTDFVKKAIERNLLIIPGGVFSEQDTHFRISFAASDEVLEQGIEILNSLAGEV